MIVLSRFILGLRGLYFSDSDPPASESGDMMHEYTPRSGAYTPVPSTETRQSLLSSSRLLGNLGATVDARCADIPTDELEDHDEEDEDEVPQFSRYPFVTGLEDCVEGRIMKYGYAV